MTARDWRVVRPRVRAVSDECVRGIGYERVQHECGARDAAYGHDRSYHSAHAAVPGD
jgi:hypothetical protein